MKIIIALLSLFVFLKTFYYGIYELKQNNNKIAGGTIIFLSFVCLVVPNVFVYLQ